MFQSGFFNECIKGKLLNFTFICKYRDIMTCYIIFVDLFYCNILFLLYVTSFRSFLSVYRMIISVLLWLTLCFFNFPCVASFSNFVSRCTYTQVVCFQIPLLIRRHLFTTAKVSLWDAINNYFNVKYTLVRLVSMVNPKEKKNNMHTELKTVIRLITGLFSAIMANWSRI